MAEIKSFESASEGALEAIRLFREACAMDEVYMLSNLKVDKNLTKWPGTLDDVEEIPTYDMLNLFKSQSGVGLTSESKAVLLSKYLNGDEHLSITEDRILIVYNLDERPNIMLVEHYEDNITFLSFVSNESIWFGDPFILHYNSFNRTWMGEEIGPELFDEATRDLIFQKWIVRSILLLYSMRSEFCLEMKIEDSDISQRIEDAMRTQNGLATIPKMRRIVIDRVQLQRLYEKAIQEQ